jgi:hypothetical protein
MRKIRVVHSTKELADSSRSISRIYHKRTILNDLGCISMKSSNSMLYFVGLLAGIYGVLGNDDVPYPNFRYVAFSDLHDGVTQLLTTKVLGYKQGTWNNPYTADVEFIDFGSLEQAQQDVAIALGFIDWLQWDCYVNHFSWYEWDELEEDGFQEYMAILGWTEASWNGDAEYPESEDMDFDELSETQREAAMQLCYFKEVWEMELSIPDWPARTIIEPSGTTRHSPMPSFRPSLRPNREPSPDMPYEDEHSLIPSDVPSLIPSDVPSLIPSNAPSTMPSPLAPTGGGTV